MDTDSVVQHNAEYQPKPAHWDNNSSTKRQNIETVSTALLVSDDQDQEFPPAVLRTAKLKSVEDSTPSSHLTETSRLEDDSSQTGSEWFDETAEISQELESPDDGVGEISMETENQGPDGTRVMSQESGNRGPDDDETGVMSQETGNPGSRVMSQPREEPRTHENPGPGSEAKLISPSIGIPNPRDNTVMQSQLTENPGAEDSSIVPMLQQNGSRPQFGDEVPQMSQQVENVGACEDRVRFQRRCDENDMLMLPENNNQTEHTQFQTENPRPSENSDMKVWICYAVLFACLGLFIGLSIGHKVWSKDETLPHDKLPASIICNNDRTIKELSRDAKDTTTAWVPEGCDTWIVDDLQQSIYPNCSSEEGTDSILHRRPHPECQGHFQYRCSCTGLAEHYYITRSCQMDYRECQENNGMSVSSYGCLTWKTCFYLVLLFWATYIILIHGYGNIIFIIGPFRM